MSNTGGEVSHISAEVISATQAYPIALAETGNWKPDAYLTKIQAEIRRDRGSQPMSITFLFESESDPYSVLSVICQEKQMGFQTSAKTYRYPSTVSAWRTPPIDPEIWAIDSVEALDIAQRNGGSAFMQRQENYDTEHGVKYLLFLEWYSKFEEVMWAARYANVYSLESLTIFIDPKTGAVREVISEP